MTLFPPDLEAFVPRVLELSLVFVVRKVINPILPLHLEQEDQRNWNERIVSQSRNIGNCSLLRVLLPSMWPNPLLSVAAVFTYLKPSVVTDAIEESYGFLQSIGRWIFF